NAAVGIAPVGIDHPFLAPGRGELDAVVVHRRHLEPEPLVIRAAGDQRLHLLGGHFLGHGVTTTLPMTSRSWISRSPSRALSICNTLSMPGFIWPAWIRSISPLRSSS